MRKLCLLAVLCSPLVQAQVVTVETNSLMRLPNTTSSLQLERLEVADYGTLLIPSNVTEVKVGELRLGREARITIVPGEQSLQLNVAHADLEAGSQITSRGAPGTYQKAAKPGRNLNLRIASLQAGELSVDARGGTGAPGYVGLDGANGEEPGCTWGQAGRGADGDNGGDGQPGRRAPRCGSSCRAITRRSRSRSGSMAGPVVWPVRAANPGSVASPRAASSIAPTVARAVVLAPKAIQGRQAPRVRSRYSACKQSLNRRR